MEPSPRKMTDKDIGLHMMKLVDTFGTSTDYFVLMELIRRYTNAIVEGPSVERVHQDLVNR
jgi:hypothetical protein